MTEKKIDTSRANPSRPTSADLDDSDHAAIDMLRDALQELADYGGVNGDQDEVAAVFRSAATVADFLRPYYEVKP